MPLTLGLAPLFVGLWVNQEGPDAADAEACACFFWGAGQNGKALMLLMLGLAPRFLLFLGVWVKQKGPDAANAGSYCLFWGGSG